MLGNHEDEQETGSEGDSPDRCHLLGQQVDQRGAKEDEEDRGDADRQIDPAEADVEGDFILARGLVAEAEDHRGEGLARREVSVAGKMAHLTPNEFKLLTVLVKNAGKVLTHRQLLREVWGPGSAEETHHLRVYMNQLRQKIEPDATRAQRLLTEPGVGYRLLDQ